MWESVRKYGLEFCDFPTMLSNVSAMLWILGADIDGRNNKRVPTLIVIVSAILSILYIYAYVISSFWFIFWCSEDLDDVSIAFVAFSLTVTSAVPFIKLFYMKFYREKLKKLTNKYLAYDALIIQGSRYNSNMLKTLREVKKRGIVYWLILVFNAIGYVVRPLLMPGRHLSLDGYIVYGLEPMMESPNFEIASIIMAIAVLFICYAVANVTCFLILTVGYNEAHMLSLSEEIINLWQDAVHHYKNNETNKSNHVARNQKNKINLNEAKLLNKFIEERLAEITDKHAATINNLQQIEDIMRGPNVIAYLLLIIGLIAELLGGLEKTYLQLPFTMLQLAVDCYLGQKVMDSNEAFERAVYGCKWQMFNVSNRRNVLLMLQNSQKTITLSAGGMATLSFSCLMSIIKSTYSAYTALRSTMK